jgi:mannosyltransferase OCH1-like enzyme
MPRLQIPTTLHIIWVGDETKRPERCIETWRANHPGWTVKVWGNRELRDISWDNAKHIATFEAIGKWAGVADLMRYEILYREGGVYVDADSFSLRPLETWLLEGEMFASWEEMLGRSSRMVNNAFIGTKPANPFLRYVIDTVTAKPQVLKRWSWSRMRYVKMGAWRSVGPHHFTHCIQRYNGTGYTDITLLPSHMFSPVHHRGGEYRGGGVVFADHRWGTTKKLYAGSDLASTGTAEQEHAA